MKLGFDNEIPLPIRIKTFYVIGDCLRSNLPNQEKLGMDYFSTQKQTFESSSIMYLIQLAIGKRTDFDLRMASLYLLECYLYKNHAAQITILNQITTSNEQKSDLNQSMSIAHLLLNSIESWEVFRKNPFPCWSTCMFLSHCLLFNREAKELALHISLEANDQNASSSLPLLSSVVHYLMFSSQEQADIRFQLGFLSLLCIWLYECPKAVSTFLNEGAHLQFVNIDLIHILSISSIYTFFF
jgi:hypothetical protein